MLPAGKQVCVKDRAALTDLSAWQFGASKVGAGVSSPSPLPAAANVGDEGSSQKADAGSRAGKSRVWACPPVLRTPTCSPQYQAL